MARIGALPLLVRSNLGGRSLVLAVPLIAVALFLLPPANAWGHAAFLDAQPEPGTRLAAGPVEIKLSFTEPLNRDLSSASLLNVRTGDKVAAVLGAGGERQIVLRPQARLRRAPYSVQWHTVSTLDGHPLEGSFSFGVRTAAVGGEHSVEQSPLARDGWLRIAARAILYASLIFFAGGVINATVLAPRRRPERWLFPKAIDTELQRCGLDPELTARRLWTRSINAGALALIAAVAVALIEAADAGGGLSLDSLNDYLLTNDAGLARVGTVAAVALAFGLARRWQVAASLSLVLAFLTIALSGHANSADPHTLAIVTDWLHLLAAAIWVGGIAQIAAGWLPAIGRLDSHARLSVIRSVLARFGRVALPAFAFVAVSGSTNALIQLGHVQELWQSSYGRVLAVKITLVGLIALASYLHALRIRPRLLATNPHPGERLERRHWRLLGVEPWFGLGAVVAVAVLVAFPLPPRQLSEADEVEAAAPCEPSCPLPNAAADVLPIADHAGSRIAGYWLRHGPDGNTSGTLRLLNVNGKPVDASVEIADADIEDCGPGCWRFALDRRAGSVGATIDGTSATVLARWPAGRSREARALLSGAQAAMRGLRTVRLDETVTSGLGQSIRTRYRFVAPDRMAYRTSAGGHYIAIGNTAYSATGNRRYQKGPFGPGGFRLREFFRWSVYGSAVRWLGSTARTVEIALFDPATPVWYRLTIDRRTKRVLREQMIAKAHFMSRRYFAFNHPLDIQPPR